MPHPDSPVSAFSSDFTAQVAEIIEQFEQAWQSGQQPNPEQYLPGGDSPWRAPLLRELIHTDLEYRLHAGQAPRIEDYLTRFPELTADPPAVVSLIRAERDLHKQAGRPTPWAVYAQRFPQYATALAAQLGEATESTAEREPPTQVQRPSADTGPLEALVEARSINATPPVPVEQIANRPSTAPAVPGYEVLAELGKGGMGVVYKARQVTLRRVVALKMIRSGAQAEAEELARFRSEAEAIARLQHPHIVQIYEVGAHAGLPFFSLEFLEGGSLAQQLRGTPLLPRQAAELVATVASAVQAAHDHGVIHRDLKPANVLLTRDGLAKITDFGLAKRVDEAGQTQTGAILGTPSYMAPEQAAGQTRAMGPLVDVYALGAILYEGLTGRPPFRAATAMQTVQQVLTTDPVPPRRLNPAAPRDLETIALKCLEKEPHKRYPSAQALAEDLRRFLAGKPVQARPLRVYQRGLRWARRQPIMASLVGALVVVTVTALAIITWSYQQAILARNDAEHSATRAGDEARAKSLALTGLQVDNAVRLMDAGDLLGALSWSVRALAEEPGGPARQRMHRRRIAELLRRCPRLIQVWNLKKSGDDAAFSPDGQRLLAVDGHTLHVWNLQDGQPVALPELLASEVWRASFSPDGRRILTETKTTARIWDARTGRPVTPVLSHRNTILHSAWSPDSRLVATASLDGTAQVWDAATGVPAGPVLRHASGVQWIEFSPDGRQLVLAMHDTPVSKPGTAQVYDRQSWRPIGAPLTHAKPVIQARFSPDGRRVATCSYDGSARVWNASTGRPVTPPLKAREFMSVWEARFSPDGSRLATASSGGTWVWDVATGKALIGPLHPHGVYHVCFSPDGRRLAIGCFDGTAQVWDASNGQPNSPPLRHHGLIGAVAFDPQGRYLLSSSADRTLRVWDVGLEPPLVARIEGAEVIESVAFSPDGRRVATACYDGTARIWDTLTGRPLTPPMEHRWPVDDVAWRPDGGEIVTRSSRWQTSPQATANPSTAGRPVPVQPQSEARLWDARTGQPVGQAMTFTKLVNDVSFSPDGARVLTGSQDGTARLWDAQTGKLVMAPIRYDRTVRKAKFDLSGQHLLLVGFQSAIVWDVAAARALTPALQHRAMINSAEFSPDGTRVVTASEDGTAQIWDVATGQPVGPPLRHTGKVKSAHFSPAGDRVVTASSDGTARVWDAVTGQPISSPMRHTDAVNDALFSPDGTMILTLGNDRGARLWDATTGQLLLPALHGPNSLWFGQFCPDGRHVLTDWCAYDKPALAEIWELTPPDTRPVEQLTRLTELLSGRRLDADGGWMPLDAEALRNTWQELQTAAPADFALLSREEMLAWHRGQLAECEKAATWFAALFHLRWLMDAAPADPTLYFRRGQALANLNRSTEALGAFTQAIEHKLPGPNAWQARGLTYVALGQWARAEADLTQAIQLKASGATAWKWRGYVRAAQNDRSGALADVTQALRLDDDDDQLWDWRLLLLAQAGAEAGVRKTCAALLAHNGTTDDANTANNTAWYCVRFGDAVPDSAVPLRLAQRAVAGKPATYAYVSTLGAALCRAHRLTEAVTRLQQGIELEGHGGGAADWFFLALAHHALGHAAEARRWYDQAVHWMQRHVRDPKVTWRDRLELDLLRKEVKHTLQGSK